MEDVREYGFSVIVDARHSSWHSTKMVLHSLQEVLPGQVHVAYIIQSSHFWQKQATTRGHNKEKKKNRLEFSTIMLSEVDKLKRHIDPSQVTFDLGGYLPYSHDDWIKLRYDLERFIASFNALMEHTSHVEQQLHMQGAEGEGGDVETAEDALTRHIQIHDQLRKAPQSTIREGNELLRRLEQGRDEGGTSAMTPDKINAVTVIRRLLESVNRRQTQMDDMWRERRAVLEQTLELRVFEKALQKVRGWLKARGEETLSSRNDIGEDLDSTQLIQEQHNKFEAKAKSMYNNLTQLRRMADRFAGKSHFAADTLQRQVAKLSTKFSRFENHLGERRRIVVGSLRFHTSYKE
ncbi:Kalirin, partial [Geodia barretti]